MACAHQYGHKADDDAGGARSTALLLPKAKRTEEANDPHLWEVQHTGTSTQVSALEAY